MIEDVILLVVGAVSELAFHKDILEFLFYLFGVMFQVVDLGQFYRRQVLLLPLLQVVLVILPLTFSQLSVGVRADGLCVLYDGLLKL